jgi:nucleotide-binding universal stress UspA family protein
VLLLMMMYDMCVQGDPGPLLVDIANKEQADILVLGASCADKKAAVTAATAANMAQRACRKH